jgi:hypothetical protein
MGARMLGIAFAAAGVALLVLGVFAFGGSGGAEQAAPPVATSPAPPSVVPSASSSVPTAAPTATVPPSASPTSQLPATPSPTASPVPVRSALTVLNNSTIRGLGERAASEARAKGWQVASVGNFAGVIPVSTVYYTPGNTAEQAAAERLHSDLPRVARVLPRYDGLPPTPTGVVLVVTRDW